MTNDITGEIGGTPPGRGSPGATGAGPYCGHCGRPRGDEERRDEEVHAACGRALRLEPPRYCAHCRRRMVVQIVPTGWAARCVAHGVLRG